jgi:hypothetical protein
VAVAIGLWALFRPEKLFINQQVNEPAPASVASIQPLFVGNLQATANSAEATGRVSVLKNDGGGLRLEVANLQSRTGQSFTIALAAPGAEDQAVVLGTVNVNQRASLSIPEGLDPAKQKDVFLMDDSKHVVAKATLEAF